MLPQEDLVARVRAAAAEDERLDALMMYGSFTRGEGDVYSDVEFLLFFEDEAFEASNRKSSTNELNSMA